VKLSLSEISTVNASFADDVAAYAAAGFDGIGIWEFKLPDDDDANVALLRRAGLGVGNCVPAVPTILQLRIPGMEGPPDPEDRIAALCASMHRLARYRPASVLCLTGPAGGRAPHRARALVVDGLRRVADAAATAGVRLGLEPAHASQHESTSIVHSIGEAVELLDDAGLDGVGVMVDTYHVWDTPDVLGDLERHAARITGVHLADWPPHDGRADRVLPGEGRSRTRELVEALRRAGWDGYLEVEIFSTPEGFWSLPVDEAARQAYAVLRKLL
jgi:sugar phosphate isomerase/epimerase